MWITPVGFVVPHENRKPKEARLSTADRTILVYHQDDKQKIDVRNLVDGIVAHLVHSMDAAHMMRTINRLHAEGIRHFATVHDAVRKRRLPPYSLRFSRHLRERITTGHTRLSQVSGILLGSI